MNIKELEEYIIELKTYYDTQYTQVCKRGTIKKALAEIYEEKYKLCQHLINKIHE